MPSRPAFSLLYLNSKERSLLLLDDDDYTRNTYTKLQHNNDDDGSQTVHNSRNDGTLAEESTKKVSLGQIADIGSDVHTASFNSKINSNTAALGGTIQSGRLGSDTSLTGNATDDSVGDVIMDANALTSTTATTTTPIQKISGNTAVDTIQQQQIHHHRHDLHTLANKPRSSMTGTLIWALVIFHVAGLLFWMRVWWKQRKIKDPIMRLPAPPQKQSVTYDLDKTFSLATKLDIPLKALNKLSKA